jgi:hypothetical protein
MAQQDLKLSNVFASGSWTKSDISTKEPLCFTVDFNKFQRFHLINALQEVLLIYSNGYLALITKSAYHLFFINNLVQINYR